MSEGTGVDERDLVERPEGFIFAEDAEGEALRWMGARIRQPTTVGMGINAQGVEIMSGLVRELKRLRRETPGEVDSEPSEEKPLVCVEILEPYCSCEKASNAYVLVDDCGHVKDLRGLAPMQEERADG